MQPLKFSQRLMLFLYSGKNIAGSLMALAGLALFFTGVINAYWWLIIAGLYGAATLAWPRSELAQLAERTELSSEMLAQQVRKLVDSVAKGLPPEAVELLHSIEATLREVLPHLEGMRNRSVISQKESFTVIETVRRYLPDTLAAYLRLPKVYAQVQTLADGKTASRTLLDQLHVLDTSLKEVAASAFSGEAEKFIANGHFLEAKFAGKAAFVP